MHCAIRSLHESLVFSKVTLDLNYTTMAIYRYTDQCTPVSLVQELHHVPGLDHWKALICRPGLPKVPVFIMVQHFETVKDIVRLGHRSSNSRT